MVVGMLHHKAQQALLGEARAGTLLDSSQMQFVSGCLMPNINHEFVL